MASDTQGKENAMNSFLKPKPLRLRRRPALRAQPAPLQEVQRAAPRDFKSPKVPRNPFRRSEGKRKLEDADEEDSLLWRRIHGSTSHASSSSSLAETSKSLPSPVVPSMLDECALSAFSETVLETREKKKKQLPTPLLPVDWSLKTRVRFTSPTPFPSNFKTFEEVNGTTRFVRGLQDGNDASKEKGSNELSDRGARFFQQSLVWMHPSLPWLTLFPRTHQQMSSGPPALSIPVQEILHSKWCDSFRSLYQLVRAYQCPFFYLCAPTFTVLFRCAGAASVPVLHALISPTTRGLRNALREVGISFTMPLCPDADSPTTPDEETADRRSEDEEEEGSLEGEEDETSWLESLGLSQDSFPSLRIKKRSSRGDLCRRVDHRPQSLVWVQDCQTLALVNLLLNSSLCSDRTGGMAGIPPTLLAPCAFLGGTLQPLQVRVGKVRPQGATAQEQLHHSVELNGPVLPSALHSLCTLFATTQGPSGYAATLTTHGPTEPFMQVCPPSPPLPGIFAQNNLGECGLPPAFVQQMCTPPLDDPPGGPLRTIRMQGGLYTTDQSS